MTMHINCLGWGSTQKHSKNVGYEIILTNSLQLRLSSLWNNIYLYAFLHLIHYFAQFLGSWLKMGHCSHRIEYEWCPWSCTIEQLPPCLPQHTPTHTYTQTHRHAYAHISSSCTNDYLACICFGKVTHSWRGIRERKKKKHCKYVWQPLNYSPCILWQTRQRNAVSDTQ